MRSGGMRHRVTIQEVTESRDSYGETTESWGTFAVRWASIEPIAGREYFQAKQENSEVDVRIRMRWDEEVADINTKMRVVYSLPTGDERIFDIEAVLNLRERNREVVLMCREVL